MSGEGVSHTAAEDSKETLSRKTILSAALRMADELGVEGVSARKLAESLGCTPMALYRHFSSMHEIRQGVLATAFLEVDSSPIPGERWDDTIRRTVTSIRQMHLRHRNAQLFRVVGSAWGPGLRAHTDRIQKLHREQGIPEDVLRRAWRIIDAFLSGFIVNEMREMSDEPAHPCGERPAWFETAEAAYSEQAFSDGIEIILQGIRALAAPDACEWRTPE